ncbi:MAG: ABC transporter ATP-binding protein/permease [Clostridiales bacterium]|jgi:ATP-binding cassette subfamily B protein|nr:ABC transporter ATP-binding protein/permease [Clostridiales bacterium]
MSKKDYYKKKSASKQSKNKQINSETLLQVEYANNNIKKPTPQPHHGPGARHGGVVDKPKNFKKSIGRLIQYLGAYKFRLFAVIILAMLSMAFAVLGPRILAMATDEITFWVRERASGVMIAMNFHKIGMIILSLVGLYLVSACLGASQGFIMARVANDVTYKLRAQIEEKIHNLPIKFYDKVPYGEVLSRVTNDVDSINQSLSQSVTQLVISFTQIIGVVIMMLIINWVLTLITMTSIILSFSLIAFVMRYSQKHFIKQQNFIGKVNAHVEEVYSNTTIVKAFNAQNQKSAQFEQLNSVLYNSSWKANFLGGLVMPITFIISNFTYVVVCVIAGYLVIQGRMGVGEIQAFIQYTKQVNQPITQISNITNILQQTAAASERIFDFLEEDEEIPDPANPIDASATDSSVEFNQVKFGYNSNKIIIKDFSVKVKPGQKIAIVGPTGAGKTTLVKLLMRFYDVNSGEILIGGHNIKDFNRRDLHKMFGMVLQDTWLYNASVEENIKYGKLSATHDDVVKAAKAAMVNHFVKALPDGYNMELNEEASNISQGQKQLLTIARAILADPKILILDEATSNVDTRTEIHIQKAMDNLMQGRTSFIIAHRLSTIKNADVILVLNEGDIVEQGTHDELLSKGGFYAKLYNSQFDVEESA